MRVHMREWEYEVRGYMKDGSLRDWNVKDGSYERLEYDGREPRT